MTHPQFQLVTASGIDAVRDALLASGRIGLDTEFMRESTFHPQLCLVQVATTERLFCIDPLGEDNLTDLWEVLAACSWVLHSGRQDIEVLYLVSGRMPRQIFDTQIAAGLLGYPPQLGYAALVSDLFGIDLPKTHTRADWSRRPLAAEFLEYAAQDVEYLLPAYDILAARLAELGRLSWAEEDSRDLLDEALYLADPQAAVLRLKGAGRLRGRMRRAASGLAAWRENEALSRDRPRQWIMKDATLLEIATTAPRDLGALQRIPGLPAKTVRRAGKRLLEILTRARSAPDEAEPPRRPEESARAVLKPMQAVIAATARELGIQQEVIASRKELDAAAAGERGLRVFRGWRRPLVGERLLELLESA